MSKALFSFFDILMMEEVGRIVKDARKVGATISTASVLAQISQTYPDLRVSDEEIVQEIIMTAASEGVPLEINTAKADRRAA
jgi:hypothetical protein